MRAPDAIVVLGGGLTDAGEPSLATMLRAEHAIDLARRYPAAKIVVSGAWGMFDASPTGMTEASRMRAVLEAAGIASSRIIEEGRSRDTLGNAVFVKRDVLLPHDLRHIVLLTSAFHADRARQIFDLVLGAGFTVELAAIAHDVPGRDPDDIAMWETGLAILTEQWFAGITPGDDAAIWTRLCEFHPIYSEGRGMTLADIADAVRALHGITRARDTPGS